MHDFATQNLKFVSLNSYDGIKFQQIFHRQFVSDSYIFHQVFFTFYYKGYIQKLNAWSFERGKNYIYVC